MRISDFSVRNPQFTVLIFLLLCALGWNAWREMPRTEDPYFPISAFQVITIYPGADPHQVEREIAEPIEDAMNRLDDVKDILSTSADSVGIVFVEFEGDVDVDKKFDDLNRELGAIRGSLPSGITRLEVKRINPGHTNIVQLALVSDTVSWHTLGDLADDLQDRLERLPGVRESQAWAFPQRELRVEADFKRMSSLNVRLGQLLNAVSGRNTNIPGGAVEYGSRRFNVQTSGNYETPEEVRDTVLAGDGSRLVRISDVADVRWDYGPDEHTARFDGHRAVFVTANQKEGQNIFVTRAAIEQALQDFQRTLPAEVKLEQGFDQSRNVDHRLKRLGADFAVAIVLVMITLLPLGLRAAGIVMVSIPLSLATGLAALHFAGFSLNQLSIAGFVVALGLLVDDSIVVVENIARYLRMGHQRQEAAMMATRQISLAVLGCTATLLFAFLPLLALPGNAGNFIRSLPLSVIFTVLASLFVALTIIPFLASRVLPLHEHAEGNAVLRALMRLIHKVYSPWLRRALARPKTTVAIAAVLVVGSFLLVPAIGFSVFPKANTPQFMVEIKLPNGSSLTKTDAVMRQVEALLLKETEIDHVMANLGHGNPKIYYNLFPREFDSSYAELFVQLKRYDNRETNALFDRLRHEFDKIPGAEVVLFEFENGPPMDAPIAIRVIGDDLPQLRQLAADVEKLITDTPGTRDTGNPLRRSRVDMDLGIDTTKAGLLGVSPLELNQAVRAAFSGLKAGEFREEDGDTYPIVVRGPLQGRPSIEALQGLHVGTATGMQVPLAQLTRPQLIDAPNAIYRYHRQRSVLLTAHPQKGYNTEKLTQQLIRQLDAYAWPEGYRYMVAGEVKARSESFAGFGTAILVTVFGIMAILVLEFGGFKSTLIVATVVPLGVMGGLLMLFITGYNLSFTAMVGFIALTGIEIKNSILLVDFTNQLREEGIPLDDAIAQAGEIRFLPILLTSVTAIGGLSPLAFQNSALYSPMAWVLIGGLISSTMIGRLVTPVMYKLLPPELKVRGRVAVGSL
ncbi:MAG TPA: efflux RND transporter permease subunit [Solimonas sp.]|nr:efflux RND transporter permease subunit [Solimonas sp.]